MLKFLQALLVLPALASAQPADEPVIAGGTCVLDREALGQERPTTPPTIENVMGRTSQSLDGEWRYLIDPMRAGLRKGNSRRDFPNDRTAEPGGPLIEYDWDESPTISVPGDWNSQIEELRWYEDLLWYRRLVNVDLERGKRYILHFEAAGYETHVWLNGEELGTHRGGFTPFEFEVTDQLEDGKNSLVVAVDAQHGKQSIPGDYFDWKNYGGIIRPVHLVEVPRTYIRDYQVSLSEDRTMVDMKVLLDGPRAAGQRVSLSLGGVETQARTDRSGFVDVQVPAQDLTLWSPENPNLHDFRVSTGSDVIEDRIGLRDIDVDGTTILLNGEPVFMRGISIHEEAIGEVGTRLMDDDMIREILGHVKSLNANFIRLAHYPHNERMVRIAEEMGLMVWSEVPIYWEVIDYSSDETMALARQMQAESIHRDFNRANIVFWSVANETPITDPRYAFLGVLIDDARAIGGDRLISAALHKDKTDGNVIPVTDPLGVELDVISVNEYEGWYGDRTLDEIREVSFDPAYEKPFIFSEFGAGALRGYRDDSDVRWTEDYQAKYFAETLKMAEDVPGLAGISPWLLKDFRSPRRWHGKYQDYWNRKGLISEAGQRKEAFEVLADWYAERAED
ncbi:MAG: glycoside hydrolase family 2 TIM barrel-domain containing protein [Pseudomonadota bacterium]